MHYRARCLLGIFCACLLLAGCGSQRGGKGGGAYLPQTGGAGAMPLFTPLESTGSHPLSQGEALALVSKLSPASQGLNSWRDMDFAVAQSLAVVSARPAAQVAVERPGLRVTWGEMARSLSTLQGLLPKLDAKPELLASSFRWVRLGPDFSFTGYYEPTLQASRTPTAACPYPLYRVPPDLRKGVPYHTREAIDRKGALRGRNLEIAWVDETDAFFLQVQGSGRLRFADGSTSHVLYGDKNNRSYVSLGRVMKEEGLLPEGGVNMKAIRKVLAENPQRRSELFDRNPSYVFFREASKGPLGGMGKPLTPWVSLAVDRRVVPYGSLTMVTVPLPDQDGRHTIPFHALTLPQDTGGAIKGNRMDLFCGPSDVATHVAGHLDVKGAVYLLLPK